nr:hypothetical protein [Lachnoclostridium phytofermentans]
MYRKQNLQGKHLDLLRDVFERNHPKQVAGLWNHQEIYPHLGNQFSYQLPSRMSSKKIFIVERDIADNTKTVEYLSIP